MIAYCFKVPIWELLFNEIRSLELKPQESIRGRVANTIRPALRRHDLGKIKTALQLVFDQNPFPPPSLRSLCSRLECHQSYVKRVLPEIATEISRRFKMFISTKRSQRIFMTKMIIRSCVNELYCRGEYPSHRKVVGRLPSWVSFREKFARDERINAMRELGILRDEHHS
jgi:hypothetical protein